MLLGRFWSERGIFAFSLSFISTNSESVFGYTSEGTTGGKSGTESEASTRTTVIRSKEVVRRNREAVAVSDWLVVGAVANRSVCLWLTSESDWERCRISARVALEPCTSAVSERVAGVGTVMEALGRQLKRKPVFVARADVEI